MEIFTVSKMFKQYVTSLHIDLREVFDKVFLQDKTIDEYCEILSDCINNRTTYNYTIIHWRSKTTYLTCSEYSLNHREAMLESSKVNNAPTLPNRACYYSHARLSLFDEAYYHTENIIDDDVSTIFITTSKIGLHTSYDLDDFLSYGGHVFLIMNDKDNTELVTTYEHQICVLCNGWYKYMLTTLALLPPRKILICYKDATSLHFDCDFITSLNKRINKNKNKILYIVAYEDV